VGLSTLAPPPRPQVRDFFSEGFGQVDTGGSLACRRTDHLFYNQSLNGMGVRGDAAVLAGLRGLTVRMDDRNASTCNRYSRQATGHLLTREYMRYGRFDFHARSVPSPLCTAMSPEQ
jgi:hypothetical protein